MKGMASRSAQLDTRWLALSALARCTRPEPEGGVRPVSHHAPIPYMPRNVGRDRATNAPGRAGDVDVTPGTLGAVASRASLSNGAAPEL